ncbi:unnamed protein product [Echinostoma caproni]|uniref:WD_REPEATS_REGION domain-containing protein n=1 Tax=Echinostoma caproni TaxID=27848 RepID=A0A183AXV0_9TREM|nr:unnamed protein product [Echinostoma caproni]
MNPSGTLLVSGSPDKIIRVWDPRTCCKLFQLSGHADNVRALIVRPDGQEVDEAWTTVFSSGKDGKIWATDLSNTSRSVLIGEESDPVLRPIRSKLRSMQQEEEDSMDNDRSYFVTEDHSVHSSNNSSHRDTHPTHFNHTPPSNPTNSLHLRWPGTEQSPPGGSELIKPDFVIPEKRFILTKDSNGNVDIYDVLKMPIIHLDEADCVSANITVGDAMLTDDVEPDGCFTAETKGTYSLVYFVRFLPWLTLLCCFTLIMCTYEIRLMGNYHLLTLPYYGLLCGI